MSSKHCFLQRFDRLNSFEIAGLILTFYYVKEWPNKAFIDNARTHWSEELIVMYAEANVLLARLPSYSPNFNPIETSFAILKQWTRRNGGLSRAYVEEYGGFGEFLRHAVKEQGSTGDPGNLFRLAGIRYPIINLE